MKTMFVLPLAIAAAIAAPAMAAPSFTVNYTGSAPVPVPANDFATQLAALPTPLTSLTTNGTISVSGKSKVTYYYLASESGHVDGFEDANGSFANYSETNATDFGNAKLIGTAIYSGAGALLAKFTDPGASDTAIPGQAGFGIFLPARATSPYTATSVWFGYDDLITNRDDNHDDFIVRADISAVPEPAMWALMVTGFGLVGVAARRRAANVVTA